jgi:hypothetical protein
MKYKNMKKKFLLGWIALLMVGVSFSQSAPPRINYQGIARNSSGGVLANTTIDVQLIVRQGSASGVSVFTETHNNITTNSFGLFTLQIGSISSLSTVNWGTNTFYLDVLVDAGSGFNQAGPPQELISTPYALFAQQTPAPVLTFSNNVLGVNGNTVSIPPGSFVAPAMVSGGITSASYNSGTNTYSVNTDAPVLTGSGNINITTGVYPNYNISVPAQTLSLIAPNTLSLTGGGGSVTLPTPMVAGDVNGPAGSNTVTAIQNISVSPTAPATGQVLQFNGTTWVPANVATGGVTSVAGVGALTGTVTSTGTIALLPSGVASGTYGAAPNVVPIFTVDQYGRITNASTISITSPTLATGDVKGPIGNNTVTAIQNTTVSPVAPLAGQVLLFNGIAWVPATPPSPTPATIQINAPHSVVTNTSINSSTITVASPTIVGTGAAVITPTTGYNFSVNVPTVTMSYAQTTGILNYSQGASTGTVLVTPSVSLTGGVLTVGPASNSVSVAGPWTQPSSSVVALTTSTNLVGIGTNAPLARLDIASTTPQTGLIVSNTSTLGYISSMFESQSSIYTTLVKNDGAGNAFVAQKGGSGLGDVVQVTNSNTSNSGNAINAQTTGTGRVILATHSGTSGVAGSFNITNSLNGSDAIFASSTGNGTAGGFIMSGNGTGISVSASGTGPAANFQKSGTGTGIFASHTGTLGGVAIFNSTNASNNSVGVTISSAGNGDALTSTSSGSGVAAGRFTKNGTGGYAILALQNATSGNAGLFDISSSSNNSQVITVQTAGNGDVIGAYNNGNGRSLYALNTSSVQTIMAVNNGLGHAVHGISTSTAAGALRAGRFQGGVEINGKSSGTSHYALWVTNVSSSNLFNIRDDGHVGIGVTAPGYKLSVVEGSVGNPAVFASNTSGISSTTAHGLQGLTNSPNAFAAGIYGESTSSGPSVFGYKGIASGPAARFEVNVPTSTADALLAVTQGSGAAVHAASGSAVGSALSLLVDAGHVKAVGTTAVIGSPNAAGGFSLPSSLACNCNDVRGSVSFVTGATGFVANNSAEISVGFQKAYAAAPIVVVTPTTDLQGLSFMVTGVTPAGFTIRIFRPSNMTTPATVGSKAFTFNYFVIE